MNKKIIIALIVLGLLLGTFVVATLATTTPMVSAVLWTGYGNAVGPRCEPGCGDPADPGISDPSQCTGCGAK